MSYRTGRARRILPVVATASVVLGLAGCGGDELDRSEFVRLTTQGDDGLSQGIASCVFDAVRQDDAVLAELGDKGPRSDELSDATDKKMQSFLAECILADRDATTTTTSKPRAGKG